MKRIALGVLLFACGLAPMPGRGEEPLKLYDGQRWHFPDLRDDWKQRQCWCPDDYVPKPCPPVPPCPKGCVDDYCPKPCPPVPPCVKGCEDDYCPKTCPLWLWRCPGPKWTCGPSGSCPR